MWILRSYRADVDLFEARLSSRSASGLSSDAGYGSRSWPGYFADRGLLMGFISIGTPSRFDYHIHSKHTAHVSSDCHLLGFYWHFLFRNVVD